MGTQKLFAIQKNVCLHLFEWRNEMEGSGDLSMRKDVRKYGQD